MTLAQLKEAVALLGFEQSVGNIDEVADAAFLWAASRAVSFVNGLRPFTDSFVLSVKDATCAVDGNTILTGEIFRFKKISFDKPILRLRTPVREDGRYLDGSLFKIVNQKQLWLDKTFRGDLLIEYDVEMPIFTDGMLAQELPLDNELCLILDVLVAYYLLIEDDPQKAGEYKARFNERYQLIDAQTRKTHTEAYYSSNNW